MSIIIIFVEFHVRDEILSINIFENGFLDNVRVMIKFRIEVYRRSELIVRYNGMIPFVYIVF